MATTARTPQLSASGSASSSTSAFRFCLSGRKRSPSPFEAVDVLPIVNAREKRRLAYPQDSSDRDLEYHRFCVNSGRNLFSQVAQSAFARFVFANDLPINTHQTIAKPEDVQLSKCSEFMIRTTDNELCHCYWLPAPSTSDFTDISERFPVPPIISHSNNYTILYLHGASGNIGHRLEVAKIIQRGLLANVLLIDYRGFGRSSGQPSELGTYLDAQAGLDWILARNKTGEDVRNGEVRGDQSCSSDQSSSTACNGSFSSSASDQKCGDPSGLRKVVLFGTSLGAAIAMHLASQEDNSRHIHAVIVENCFTSIGEISRYYVPNWIRPLLDFVKSTLVCPMYDCLSKAARIRCPVLYLVGLRDPVVPAWMSQILYSQTSCAIRKAIREFPEGRHNDLPSSLHYIKSIYDFLTDGNDDNVMTTFDYFDSSLLKCANKCRSMDPIIRDKSANRQINGTAQSATGTTSDDTNCQLPFERSACSMISLPVNPSTNLLFTDEDPVQMMRILSESEISNDDCVVVSGRYDSNDSSSVFVASSHSNVVADDPVTADPVAADHVAVDHVTADHVTADHVTADHVTADHVTADPVTTDHITTDPVAVMVDAIASEEAPSSTL